MYQYEALPVLVNIFLFLLLLYPYRNVYRFAVNYRRVESDKADYFFAFLLLTLYTTFGYADNDFYHYKELYKEISFSGINRHIEPVYFWIKDNISDNSYLLWRLVIWGSATILMLWTIKRLKLKIQVATTIIVCFYLVTGYFSVLRESLGVSIMFFGYSFFVKPVRPKIVSYVLAIALIGVSVFFHGNMILSIAMLAVTLFRMRKWMVAISILVFPVLVKVVESVISYAAIGNFGDVGEDMQIGSKFSRYAAGSQFEYNANGYVSQVIYLLPLVVALCYMVKKITFDKEQLPRWVQSFYMYWYAMTYVALLFLFQETSGWFFSRFLFKACFPMVVVLTYYLSTHKPTRTTRLILTLALFACFFRLIYTFYSRLRLEGMI